MIGRIMLHKKTLLFAALSAALWGGATQAADAAVVASLKPVGFIASAIADVSRRRAGGPVQRRPGMRRQVLVGVRANDLNGLRVRI